MPIDWGMTHCIAKAIGVGYNLLFIKMNETVRKNYDMRISMDIDSCFLSKTGKYDFESNDIC